MSEVLKLDQVRSDGGTQSRAGLDMDVVMDYADQMENGAHFPPIIVFYDGTTYWLADGFHRLEARRQGGMTNIAADIRQGDRRDALRYSLGANDKHGLPRNAQDYRRAYQCAVDNDLCKPDDTAAVQKLLNCSRRWSQTLTREAREQAKSERDRKITELAAEGKTQREIAAEVSVDVATVNRSVAKRNSAEMQQPTPPSEKQEADMGKPARVKTDPDKGRLYEEGSCLSAWVLASRAKTAIQQISKEDPNAVAAIDSIRDALEKQTSIIYA